MPFDFATPLYLLLLPLAALPLLPRRRDSLVFSAIAWLPPDRIGRAAAVAWRALAVLTMAAIVLGLAGPGRSGAEVARAGRGAEVLILMDRSSSMDAKVHLNGVAQTNFSIDETKSATVRRLLGEFIARRPTDRFAFMSFSSVAMLTLPFTQQGDVTQAALAATGIGRGLPDTRLGNAMLAGLREFEGSSYSGSRVMLIVSDGGAQLDAPTQDRIRAGLARERIGLYWIYIRSGPNSPSLVDDATGTPANKLASNEETALHNFFKTLATPYHLYQTDDSAAMAAAMAEIDRQQNFPRSYFERVPRVDFSGRFFALGMWCCLGLLLCEALRVRMSLAPSLRALRVAPAPPTGGNTSGPAKPVPRCSPNCSLSRLRERVGVRAAAATTSDRFLRRGSGERAKDH